jgi:DNA-binding response OmpR family regulator
MNTLLKPPSDKVVAAPIQNDANPPRHIRILLVDDDPDARELNAEVLIRFGYSVGTARDGAEAWNALIEEGYDLLITDNKMPRVTGLELIKQLRSEDMMLPVILATGMMPAEELKRHPWLQIDAMLSKPFTMTELLDTVKKVLHAADSARICVEMDFPIILKAISEIESPSRYRGQRPSVMKNSEITSVEKSAIASTENQTNPPHRILVVDDDRDTRQLSVDVLAGSGYDVEAVTDGAAGWDALQAGSFDLAITDNKMPKMTGIEMIEKLRSAHMALPVIMATRHLPTHEFTRKPWLKPNAMLQRPFSSDNLLATVKNVLRADNGDDSRQEKLLPMYL